MYNPPAQLTSVDTYTYPRGHSLLLLRLKAESCEVSRSRKQRFNKRLFQYVLPFNVSELTIVLCSPFCLVVGTTRRASLDVRSVAHLHIYTLRQGLYQYHLIVFYILIERSEMTLLPFLARIKHRIDLYTRLPT